MDVLKDKTNEQYDYTSRYTTIPYYYHTLDKKYTYGIWSNLKNTTSYVAHNVKDTDNLDYLALKYYNNPTYWWVIAAFNDIQDPFIRLVDSYSVIKIPNIQSIDFGDRR